MTYFATGVMFFVTGALGFVGAAPVAKRWLVATMLFATFMNGINFIKMAWLLVSPDVALTQVFLLV